jgi:hypothetical protein
MARTNVEWVAALFSTERSRGFENPLPRTEEAAEKVAVANRKRPSAAKAGPVFNQLRTG